MDRLELHRVSHLVASTLILLLSAAWPRVASAQQITLDDLECVPLDAHGDGESNHALVTASVTGAEAGSEVRLYFRRLDPDVEDFYYTVMHSSGDGGFWGVLPDPEVHWLELADPSEWMNHDAGDPWRSAVGSTEPRDWLTAGTPADLASWLEDQANEPVEYFAALYTAAGSRLAMSEMKIAPVRSDCVTLLDDKQRGESENQTIGETASWQNNMPLWHWECDHLVSRINYAGVKEPDAVCRACVIAAGCPWWRIFGCGGDTEDEDDEDELPAYPWPPPKASDVLVLSSVNPDVLPEPGQSTLGDLFDRFERALHDAGFDRMAVYKVPGGFAVATRVERIDEKGTPLRDRWVFEEDPGMRQMLADFFFPDTGYFRVLVFTASTRNEKAMSGQKPSRSEAVRWLEQGAPDLPPGRARKRFTEKHVVSVYVYDFEQAGSLHAELRSPGSGSPRARVHLELAGLSNLAGEPGARQ